MPPEKYRLNIADKQIRYYSSDEMLRWMMALMIYGAMRSRRSAASSSYFGDRYARRKPYGH